MENLDALKHYKSTEVDHMKKPCEKTKQLKITK